MARRPAVFSAAPSPPSQSPTPLPNVFSVCCFGSAYVPACILLKGDLMVLILLLLFHVDLFTYQGLFFFCYGLGVGLQDTHQLLQGIKLVPFPLQDNLFK